jgi:phage terminase small subunit
MVIKNLYKTLVGREEFGSLMSGSKHIVPHKNGSNKLTDKQLMFVHELAADGSYNITKAAERAGFGKNSAILATRMLKTNKHVRAALGKVLYDRIERVKITQDDVLKYLDAVLFFNPLHWFRPSKDGAWLITDPDEIPHEVGILIESMKVRSREDSEGNVTQEFEIKMVSKSAALALAMKHIGVEKAEITHRLDWDDLYEKTTISANPIEDRLRLEESK